MAMVLELENLSDGQVDEDDDEDELNEDEERTHGADSAVNVERIDSHVPHNSTFERGRHLFSSLNECFA